MTSSAKLLSECAKYLNSEGIYYKKSEADILACINGQFVMFEFGEDTVNRKLKASGGQKYRPRSLSKFITIIRQVQSETICRK